MKILVNKDNSQETFEYALDQKDGFVRLVQVLPDKRRIEIVEISHQNSEDTKPSVRICVGGESYTQRAVFFGERIPEKYKYKAWRV